MNEYRDMKRVNKACCSVQANIMSLMNRDSILLIEDSLKKEQNNTAEKEKQMSTRKVTEEEQACLASICHAQALQQK